MIQDFGDPFNWEFPKRTETMSLQTINPRDTGFQIYKPNNERNMCLKTSDIRGASPELKPYKYTNKETFINRNDDIDKSNPKKLFNYLNKESFVLKNEDIKGTKTQVNQFQTTRQSSNPLEPVYKLPHVEYRQPTPPKFLRDTLEIRDIEGTKPEPKVFKPRKENIYTEIEGSKPKQRFQPKEFIDSLNVNDINQYKRFISQRQTNPLQPTYDVPKNQSSYNKYSTFYNPDQYGQIEKSVSKRLHPENSNKINGTLYTKDINGAQHDTHTDQFLRRNERKDYRVTNQVNDMPWANAGSLRKGIQTIRSTNPLRPEYELPGVKEEIIEKQQDLFQKTTAGGFQARLQRTAQKSEPSEQQSQKRNSIMSQSSNQTNNILQKRNSIRSQQAMHSSQQKQTAQQIVASRADRRSSGASSVYSKQSKTSQGFQISKPEYDTLGNKIEQRSTGGTQVQFCDTHKKNEPVSRSGITSTKPEGNLSKAQKLDRFIN